MTQPVFTTPGLRMVDLNNLANQIMNRFMPSVFNCACNGLNESCRKALNDGRVWERREAVEQIAAFIREQVQS